MREENPRRVWTEVAGFTVLGIILYKVGVLFFLFLIPFQLLIGRRGFHYFLISCGIFLGVSFLFTLGNLRIIDVEGLSGIILLLELGIPLMFLLGLGIVNYPDLQFERKLYGLLVSAGIIGVISVPVILLVSRNEELIEFFRQQLGQVFRVFSMSGGEADSFETGIMENMLETDSLFLWLKEMILRNYLFIFFVILTANWWAGTTIIKRSMREKKFDIVGFRLPDQFIWPLLISWAVVLLDVFKGIGWPAYLFWNTGMIALFLFGLQGFGIVRHLLKKYALPRSLRTLLTFIVVILVFIPGANLVIFIGFPGLGVSELWIKYRKAQEGDTI